MIIFCSKQWITTNQCYSSTMTNLRLLIILNKKRVQEIMKYFISFQNIKWRALNITMDDTLNIETFLVSIFSRSSTQCFEQVYHSHLNSFQAFQGFHYGFLNVTGTHLELSFLHDFSQSSKCSILVTMNIFIFFMPFNNALYHIPILCAYA